MAIGLSFRLAPGVRVRASSRGVRASIGPRAARVHVGSGRTRISSGVGPVTISSGVGGRRPSSTPGRAAATAQVQARADSRARQVAAVGAAERRLTQQHLEDFPTAVRALVSVPREPSAESISVVARGLYREAVAGIPVWRRASRRSARQQADSEAVAVCERRHIGDVVAAQLQQARADEQWEALAAHHPLTVVTAVDEAFADNASRSTCVDAGTDAQARYVTVVVLFGGVELVPEQRPDLTPGGKPTLRRRTKTDRNDVYATAIASTVIATAKEALAVAVAATEVRVLVVRPDSPSGRPVPVYAGTLQRATMTRTDWRAIDPLRLVMSTDDALMVRKGSTRQVEAIPVETGSPAEGLLTALAEAHLQP